MNTLSPGVNVRESSFDFYVSQRSTTACGMMGVAQRGPINAPTLITSWEQFVKRFGGYLANYDLAYAVRSFFDNGGKQLYVNRVCHYSDITDRTTLAAAKSDVTIKDRSGARATKNTGVASTDLITWRAVHPGTAGNSITVTLAESGSNTVLSIGVNSNAITVNLATDEEGDAISTVTEVLAAVAASAAASALVTATSTDTGVVSAATLTTLTGGQAASDSLTITALDEGTWGDSLTIEVQDGTRNPSGEFNLVVRYKNAIVETFSNLSLDSDDANYAAIATGKSEYIRVSVDATAPLGAVKRPATGTFSLTGGDDGLTSLDDTDYIGDQAAHTGLYGFDDIFDLSLIAMPGITSGAVINAALGYAELRKDVFVIADAPKGADSSKALEFRRGTGEYSHTAFNSSYGALYWPALRIIDPVTRLEKVVPVSGAIAGCYVRSDEARRVFGAPAGVEVGRIFGSGVVGVEYQTQRADRDALYPEGVNVVAVFPDSGITIWGQRTLQAESSSTDRVNVRRLLIWLERSIGDASRWVTFRPNLPETWRALLRLVVPFLQNVKSEGGLYDYRVQCDEGINTPEVQDRNELRCRIFVKPTKTAEFIELEFVKTDSGTDFTEIFNG